MDYTLEGIHYVLQQFADKVESDYFTLPELLNHFSISANKFISGRLDNIEETQQITDDILPLIVPGSLDVIQDPNDSTRYIAPLPIKYLRLVSYDILYADGTSCRRADKMKQAEYKTSSNSPYRRGSRQYPIILQENNMFQIDAGPAVPSKMKIKFAKKPRIAKTNEKTRRIINLPDEAIDKILLDTVTRLFNRTGDQRIKSNLHLEDAFKKFID
jgi:hypothetical protein